VARQRGEPLSLTQYYTATTLDGYIADPNDSLEWLFTRNQDREGPLNYGAFIADVGALAMGSTTSEWNVWIVGGGDLVGQFADVGLLDEVIVYVAPVTLGAGKPLLPRYVELRLEETARNGDFVTARYAVVR
jgi:dihydrofolate reductase